MLHYRSIYMRVSSSLYIHIRTFQCTYMCIYVCVFIYIYIFICVNVNILDDSSFDVTSIEAVKRYFEIFFIENFMYTYVSAKRRALRIFQKNFLLIRVNAHFVFLYNYKHRCGAIKYTILFYCN